MDSSRPSWEPGRVVGGKYELIATIGQGGMGSVWRAENRELGSMVALKQLDEDLASSSMGRARFIREAKAAAALRSPHVIQVFDSGVDDGTPFIVMELLDGESLATRLSAGPLSNEETVRIVNQIARALAKAHEAGIVHRDLKPGNVFLMHNDDEELVKVLDFGIAKHLDGAPPSGDASTEHPSTETGAVIGTPHYMSPEQARGKPVDPRSDLWSLGVLTYTCLLGRKLFQSDNFGGLVLEICSDPLPTPSEQADLPPAFDAWFEKALRRDPEKRFQSAKEMASELKAALLGETGGEASTSRKVRERRASGSTSDEHAVAALSETTATRAAVETDASPKPASPGRYLALGAVVLVGGVLFLGLRGDDESATARSTPTVDTTAAAAPTSAASGVDSEAPVPTASAVVEATAPAEIELTFRGAPAGAVVKDGDRILGPADGPILLARGDEPKELEISAPGFEPRVVKATPTEDQTLDGELRKQTTRSPSRPPSAPPPTAPPKPSDILTY